MLVRVLRAKVTKENWISVNKVLSGLGLAEAVEVAPEVPEVPPAPAAPPAALPPPANGAGGTVFEGIFSN